jgi:hypothetical protein
LCIQCPLRAIIEKEAFCMEYQEKILLLVTVLLVALAVYLIRIAPVAMPSENVSTADAEALLMKGLSFGAGQENYTYAYRELSDGYRTSYVLTKNGNESMLEVQNPLSSKTAYFLNNDTILCITYGGNESCASVQNEKDLANYLNSLRAKFFSDGIIQRNKDDMSYLIYNGYARLSPGLAPKAVEGKACTSLAYALDFSNMSISEAARFGVGITTPKVFSWEMCVDNATGYAVQKSFNYTYEGIPHSYLFTLVSYVPQPAPIAAPENLSGDVITPLLNEKEQQIRMANCYTSKQGDELDKCLATIALDNRRKDLCEYAGGRRDRCLVSIVPVTRDQAICAAIASDSYRDDCYIELAGAYKNSSWCASVRNTSKTDFCMNVSLPVTPLPQNVTPAQGGANASDNTGNSTVDINKFLNYIEGQGDANVTNKSNGTG